MKFGVEKRLDKGSNEHVLEEGNWDLASKIVLDDDCFSINKALDCRLFASTNCQCKWQCLTVIALETVTFQAFFSATS